MEEAKKHDPKWTDYPQSQGKHYWLVEDSISLKDAELIPLIGNQGFVNFKQEMLDVRAVWFHYLKAKHTTGVGLRS